MTDHPPEPAASVVIPAYNEGRVIARCLDVLTSASAPPLEIVVAANGCSDDTVDVARSFGVRVLDIPEGSKIGALRAGDAACSAFPRIYLDADVVLDRESLAGLVEGLDVEEARAAAPSVRFVTDRSSLGVRLFYDVYRDLPYVRRGLIGLGVYGLSRAGRARFDTFPDVQADDLFVQRLFAPSERLTTPGHFEVQAPRDLRSLVRVRTRIAAGNAELERTRPQDQASSGSAADFSASSGGTARALLGLVRRRPTAWPAAVTYAGVVAAGRLGARTGPAAWHRDDSTR